jgi:hypothetical protein
MDQPAVEDTRIQRQRALKAPNDLAEDASVLLKGVRIERRHDASRAQINQRDEGLADSKKLPGPASLFQSRHASNHKVRSQPAPVVRELFDSAVGRQQQRQDVKSVQRFVGNQEGSWSNIFLDIRCDFWVRPRQPIDDRVAVPSGDGSVPQELWVRSSGHNTSASVLNVDRPVALDASEAERHALETLAGHRLDGIAPDFS